ncbi:MAG: aspartate-semialdehyde dehydrogenase [Candidatus Paceibacteria bacterium]|jgi:aspartate-semialdehyde dehydrogenase
MPPPSPLPVAILGATGAVGQRFLCCLKNHPWFRIERLFASPRSAGKTYAEAVSWVLPEPIPTAFATLEVEALPAAGAGLGIVRLAFSALDAGLAKDVESDLARSGITVFSNASSHRMDEQVPLVVPEINPGHLALGRQACTNGGAIITNPNCSTIGLVLAIGPLHEPFGIRRVSVVTQQARSGAGLVAGSFMELENNVLPFIPGEEAKLATETLKLLGELKEGRIAPASFPVSATCTRVPVTEGHLICVSIELENPVTREELIKTWTQFRSLPQTLNLPTAPVRPVHWLEANDAPQALLHADLEDGMAISIGRLRPETLFGEPIEEPRRRGWKFITLSHNTIRGAAGGSVLNAELWLEGS